MERSAEILQAIDALVVLLLALLFLVATVANTLILAVLYRRPALRSTSNRLISSLSVTNLLSSSVLLPLVIIDTVSSDSLHADVCRPLDAVAMFVITSSVFSTVVIAVDKFCAVEEPLRYHAVMTAGRAALLVAVGWTVSLASAAASTIGELRTRGWTVCQPRSGDVRDPHDHSDEFRDNRHWTSRRALVVILQVVVVFLVPLALLAWIYLSISRSARRCSERARTCARRPALVRVSSTEAPPPPPPPPPPLTGRRPAPPPVRTLWSRLCGAGGIWHRSEARAAKVSVSVVVLFACCYVPYFALELVRVSFQRPFPSVYTHISLIFVVSNAALAPFLYSLRAQNMQHEVLRLFERRACSHSAPHRVQLAGGGRRSRRRRAGAPPPTRILKNPLCRLAMERQAAVAAAAAAGGGARFDTHGLPTYTRDSSLDSSEWSSSSAMTGVTVVCVEAAELDAGPIHRL